jgi:lactate dehydrogenase-like 2-hydroxyacid dehydrogenase
MMCKPEILLAAPFSEAETRAFEAVYDVHRLWDLADPEAYLRDGAGRVRAVATTGATGVSRDLVEKLPALEIIAIYGVGLDAVDLVHARSRDVRVSYTPDVLTDDVADLALGLLLAVARRIPSGDRWVRSGLWSGGPMPLTTSLRGRKLGIFGLGRIGRSIAARATAFGMYVSYNSRSADPKSPYPYCPTLMQLAKDCDDLIISASANAETTGAVDAAVLEALGSQGFLINIARGSVVDEPALISALKTGMIAGAGLDVFCNEPNIDARFAELDNVVLLPHVGSGTFETRAAIVDLVLANLAAHFAGEPLLTPVV